MKATTARVRAFCVALGVLSLAGCQRESADQATINAEPSDTAARALDGLTPEQIEQRAQGISPQEAEDLGVVDTTIHVTEEP